MTSTEQPQPSTSVGRNGKRRFFVALVLGIFLLAGLAYGAWWWLSGRFHESTDDAYVSGNLVQVTPQVAGTVVSIHAEDTDYVKSGQVLVELDKADARVALEQAEAQLAQAVRGVRNLKATSGGGEAIVVARRAELKKAEQDLERRRKLASSGAVSGEELQHAQDAVTAARAGLEAAQQQLQAQRALVDRTSIEDHPEVKVAAAKVREAYLNLERTSIPAPLAGFVARRSVQVGQRVSPGAGLMTIVPLEDVWVDANFKEGQLAHLRTGQPVTLTADAYGDDVTYHGRIAGFSAGTGSAFALLPAQNATGNWIKVVQRVPVKIELDPRELNQHPLQIGLSMQVEVDTHRRDGARLDKSPRTQPATRTDVYGARDDRAERRVAEIIQANSAGGSASAAAAGRVAWAPRR